MTTTPGDASATIKIGTATPYEILAVTACAVASALALIWPDTQARSLLAAFVDDAQLLAYNIGIIMAAVVVIDGWLLTVRALRVPAADLSIGLQVERVGLALSGPLLMAYSAALFGSGPRGVLAGSVCLAIAAAHLLRVRRITRDVSNLQALASIRLETGDAT